MCPLQLSYYRCRRFHCIIIEMILTIHLKPLLHSTEHKKPDLMQIISWIKVYNGKHYFEKKNVLRKKMEWNMVLMLNFRFATADILIFL